MPKTQIIFYDAKDNITNEANAVWVTVKSCDIDGNLESTEHLSKGAWDKIYKGAEE